MSDAFMVAGFILALVGIYLIAGGGWACVAGGAVLFIAGGLSGRQRTR